VLLYDAGEVQGRSACRSAPAFSRRPLRNNERRKGERWAPDIVGPTWEWRSGRAAEWPSSEWDWQGCSSSRARAKLVWRAGPACQPVWSVLRACRPGPTCLACACGCGNLGRAGGNGDMGQVSFGPFQFWLLSFLFFSVLFFLFIFLNFKFECGSCYEFHHWPNVQLHFTSVRIVYVFIYLFLSTKYSISPPF
jgi:hypothetical protein